MKSMETFEERRIVLSTNSIPKVSIYLFIKELVVDFY
jgi:hypothetical protein